MMNLNVRIIESIVRCLKLCCSKKNGTSNDAPIWNRIVVETMSDNAENV